MGNFCKDCDGGTPIKKGDLAFHVQVKYRQLWTVREAHERPWGARAVRASASKMGGGALMCGMAGMLPLPTTNIPKCGFGLRCPKEHVCLHAGPGMDQ